MAFRRVAKLEDLWSGEMMATAVDGEQLLLVNINDQVFAYADSCPHQKSRLSEGTLTEGILRCARHHWEFDACNGTGVNPRNTCLKSFPIKLEGEYILVDLETIGASTCATEGGQER